jgi:hypothetical protein
MKNKLQTLLACLAALALCAPLAAFAATKKSSTPAPNASASPKPKATASPATKPTTPPAAPTTRAVPFRGVISAVDQKAKTFTIAGKEKSRVFKITDKTVLTKAGAAATMKDVVPNEEVRGSYWKAADGSLEAKTVKLGPKTEAEKAAAAKKKSAPPEASASPSASPSVSPSSSPSASATP